MSTPTQSPTQEFYCVFDTAMGACGVAWSELGLTKLQLPEVDRAATDKRLRSATRRRALGEPPPSICAAIRQIQDYLAGREIDFSSISLDLKDTDAFRRKVYQLARSIGWGQTATYGDLARLAGSPEAARDVGQAMGRNRIPLVIPCHRILASANRIGGFSAPGGTLTKRYLLALEGHGMLELFRPR